MERQNKNKINYKAYLNSKGGPEPKVLLEDSFKDRIKDDSMEENVDNTPSKLKVYTTPQKKLRSRPQPHKGDESNQKEENDNHKRMSDQFDDSDSFKQNPFIEAKDNRSEQISIALSDKERELEDMQNQFLSKIDERAKKEVQLQELNTIIMNLQKKLREKTQENHELRDKINFLLQTQ